MTEIFHYLARSASRFYSHDLVRLKAGARSFILVSHVGGRDPNSRSFSSAFPRLVARSWIGNETDKYRHCCSCGSLVSQKAA